MKASTFLDQLVEAIDEHGDIDIVAYDPNGRKGEPFIDLAELARSDGGQPDCLHIAADIDDDQDSDGEASGYHTFYHQQA